MNTTARRFRVVERDSVPPRPIPVYLVEFAEQRNRRIAVKAALLLLMFFALWIGLALR
jgi:hypothetical protein